jgi:uncharacterized protein (UPF0335 family)
LTVPAIHTAGAEQRRRPRLTGSARAGTPVARTNLQKGALMLDKNPMVATESVAADQLKAFIERIERLEEEKASLAGDIREVYGEAKGNGFDTKVIRKIVAMRKKDFAEWREEEAILDLYMQALGMT